MRALLVLAAACALAGAAHNRTRYQFYRHMRGAGAEAGAGAVASQRRLFGARAAGADAWGAACALLDRFWATRCSGAVVAPRWALTAAHCVSPRLAYVKYNSHRPASKEGDVAPVHYLYRHPGYRVVQEDEGRGVDVTLLHHDVGLVRTRADMVLAAPPPPARAAPLYDERALDHETVEVLGFGRTERAREGEQLVAARLVVGACARGAGAWLHVVCGRAAGAGGAGACAGDSGGPVLYRGAQVAVTSMGPAECAGGVGGVPSPAAASVFTVLHRYAALINSTIHDADEALRMQRVPPAPAPAPAPAAAAAARPRLYSYSVWLIGSCLMSNV